MTVRSDTRRAGTGSVDPIWHIRWLQWLAVTSFAKDEPKP